MDALLDQVRQMMAPAIDGIGAWTTSPAFYLQLGMILVAVLVAMVLSAVLRRRIARWVEGPSHGQAGALRRLTEGTGSLLFLVLTALLLGLAVGLSTRLLGEGWGIRGVQALTVIALFYVIISRFVTSAVPAGLFRWVGIPVVTLLVFGWLDDVAGYLDSLSLEIGSIRFSLLVVVRTLIFGGVLFWLGRISSSLGVQMIRSRETLDAGTREVFAKLFEIGLFIVTFILLLGVMGINLTALAVFGGALGVGLGFGLQQIAANFISGIIILLDRSITIGDYIEFDDGRAGTIREMNMRSATLETFDGKDIMVPNEQFITSSFVNWTHKDPKQRYSLEFSVSYKTDLHRMLALVREVVASHPQVLSGPELPVAERPDAEISSFGDSGVNILVEFWMEGIDDGKNRVGAELLLRIWDVLHEHGIEIPFPQREVRILNPSTGDEKGA